VPAACAVVILAGCANIARLLPSSVASTVSAKTTCTGTAIRPSDDRAVQRVLDARPPGTTFCFAPGTYRFTRPVNPKAGQRLVSTVRHGAVLNGAAIVGPFSRSGNAFVARAFLKQSPESSLNCAVPKSLCDTRQDVFFDGKPLTRVTSRGLVGKTTFYEDFSTGRLWLGVNPSGHVVEQALASALVWSSNGGIVVDAFVVEFAANRAQSGAIQSYGYSGTGWTLENNVVRYNHAAGIASVPDRGNHGGSLITGNTIAGNGQEGIAAVGDALTIRDNEITRNNRVNYSCWWECGGAKFAGGPGYESRDLVVEDNDVHDNNGPGFWNDINSYNVVYRRNRVVRNVQTNGPYGYTVGSGIFIEISDRALIEDNLVENNGPPASRQGTMSFYLGAQIEASASANVTVRSNRVSGAGGIGMLQQARSDSCVFGTARAASYPDGTPVCPHRYRGKSIHWVHDNTFENNAIVETAAAGRAEVAGLDCDLHHDGAAFSPANHNVYAENSYTLPERTGAYFSWLNKLMRPATWTAHDQDAGSKF
jgi:hypothetical protein